jgi:hypothetical protein
MVYVISKYCAFISANRQMRNRLIVASFGYDEEGEICPQVAKINYVLRYSCKDKNSMSSSSHYTPRKSVSRVRLTNGRPSRDFVLLLRRLSMKTNLYFNFDFVRNVVREE